jgi:hypothetical protein
MRKYWAILAAVLAPLACGDGSLHAGSTPTGTWQHAVQPGFLVHDGQTGPLAEIPVEGRAGEPLILSAHHAAGEDSSVPTLLLTDGERVRRASGQLAIELNQPTSNWLLLIASDPGATPQADLFLGGHLWQRSVPVGGWQLELANVRAGEEIQTVLQPAGAGPEHVMYVIHRDRLLGRVQGGGTAGAVLWRAPVDLDEVTLVIGSTEHTGPIRVIRNDALLGDADGDGLGDDLEAELQTCSSLSGYAGEFDCSLAADPRDTDGDGISDGWEVLGRQDMLPHQPLPAWGANPRHKDLFLEIDFMLRSPGEPPQQMTPEVARQFARYYQDQIEDVSPLLRLYHAVSLRNPDREPGITVHFDTGRPPESPEDATLYGDWGGYTAVPPVMDADGTWKGADYKTAWQTYMEPARRGIFRYGLPYAADGGQTSINSFAFTFGIPHALVGAHELGHGMGLGHSGPAGAPGDTDPNCKPNYPSLMNYAYDDSSVGFSDGLGAPSLNNAAIQETNAVPASSTAYLDVLQHKFGYWVDHETGSVDWNRDGYMAPESRRVRAYANFHPGKECEYTRYNQSRVLNATSTRSPAMARLGDRLYVFFSVLGDLRYTYSTSSWDCPVPSTDPCGTWNDHERAYMDASQGVDVIRISKDTLLVVTIDHAGTLWEARLTVTPAGQERWTPPTILESGAAGEPALERITYAEIYLAFRGTDHRLRWKALHPLADGWQPTQVGQATDGAFIELADHASPGLVRAYLPWKPGLQALYGAFPDPTGQLRVWGLDVPSGRWEDTQLVESFKEPVGTRPALAWVPYQPNADYPGRLYIVWSDHHDTKPVTRMLMSYVRVQPQEDGSLERTERIGLRSPFDNVPLYSYGSDLLFERLVDTNLRSVHSYATRKEKFQVWFRPNADGINDFLYGDSNDWESLRYGLCRNVVNPSGLVADPITCP